PSAGVAEHLRKHLYCHQGYAVALPLNHPSGPDGVFISHERPMRSIRTIGTDDGRLLQIGGAAHVNDPNSGDTPYDDLEAWAREHFEVGPARYRWTTQDYSSADGMPLVGRVDANGLYVATGFGGWGLTTAGAAASIMRSQIVGHDEPSEIDHVFDPLRALPLASSLIVSEHTSSGTDRDAIAAMHSLTPGTAAIVTHAGEQIAAYRTTDDQLQLVSAVCTHLGGIVLWDSEDTTWTCPCHGSKFKPDGEVCAGPARTPLPDMRHLIDHE
ncbi:MAG: oxidoreductase, partial [Thermoleophilia bacterium]|nr:oxidoreductase [Thermoleophilia bacterium]